MTIGSKDLGGIYKGPKGTWVAKVPVGKYPNGRTQYVKESYRTKSEAISARAELIRRRESLEIVAGPRVSFQDWCEEIWRNGSDRISERTLDGYYRTLKKHVFPVLGHKALRDITTSDIQSLLHKLRYDYQANTVKNVRVAMSKMFTVAVAHGRVKLNPVRGTEKPVQGEHDPTPMQPPWSESEAADAMKAFEGTKLYVPMLLMLNSGLRLGELLALKWEDIDWASHTITVSRTGSHTTILQPDGSTIYGWQERRPKTRTSRRTLQLTSPMIDELRVYQAEYDIAASAMGGDWQGSGYVFVNEVGGPVDSSRFRKQYKRQLKKHGVRHIRLHDVRHTFATILIEKDGALLPAVSKALGHSTIAITMDVYAQTAKIDQQATLAMGDVVFPDRKKVVPNPLATSTEPLPTVADSTRNWVFKG
jgi:integrase